MMESKVEAVAAAGTALQGAGPSRAPGGGLGGPELQQGAVQTVPEAGHCTASSTYRHSLVPPAGEC